MISRERIDERLSKIRNYIKSSNENVREANRIYQGIKNRLKVIQQYKVRYVA